jgi:Flp pilus assembly protein TadG
MIEFPRIKSASGLRRVAHRAACDLMADCRGISAVEFAFILPLMLVMFFGTLEFSQGIAVNRKVTLIARTLSDLTSQSSAPIVDSNLQNIFTAAAKIVTPYPFPPTKAQITQIYVNSSNVATVQWSEGATFPAGSVQAQLVPSTHHVGDTMTIPSSLNVAKTFLIFSETSYQYVPTIGYVMATAGVNLSDVSYSRPRQVSCVIYDGLPANNCATP